MCALAAVPVLFVAWLAACFVVLVAPSLDRPTKADAVFVLGPTDADGRLDTARNLMNRGLSANLVLSVSVYLTPAERELCDGRSGLPGTVTCFNPTPATTRGEAQEIRDMTAQHGWKKVIVITSRYHITRARVLIDRCYSGSLEMVESASSPSLAEWAYQFAYQTGGFMKVFARSSC